MNITTPLVGSVATGYGAEAPAPELSYKESEKVLKMPQETLHLYFFRICLVL